MFKNLKEFYEEKNDYEKKEFREIIEQIFAYTLFTLTVVIVVFLLIVIPELLISLFFGVVIALFIVSGLFLHKINQYDKEETE